MDKGNTCEHLNKLVEVLENSLWQSKETLSCVECGCSGPNLWICLQPDCHHIGCSETNNDHSTIHQKNMSTHCVHMNVSTERIWCYVCQKEVHIKAALAYGKPQSISESFSIGGSAAARLGFDRAVGHNVVMSDDPDVDEESQQGSGDVARGLVGLQNMGNTCYMNAALQALSNTAPLTDYFLECAGAVSVLAGDKKPGLSKSYQKLIKDMWTNKTRGYVAPNGILYGIRNVHPMFRGYHQHDTQEFLRCFMDQLHEELEEPVWDNEEKLCDADGDHSEPNRTSMRQRAASSGEASYFSRMRRKSPALSEARADGYLRVHTQSESEGPERAVNRHRRSASFAGTQQRLHAAAAASGESDASDSDAERYETCSSGGNSDTPETHAQTQKDGGAAACGSGDSVRYRSVISDVFDGKLLSAVQCLICDRVSTRIETFQDLSLPIPSREHLQVLRSQQPLQPPPSQDSWLWWLVSWLRSWLYGPVVSLQDCLAAFFQADELKGDNMYSCSRCNKLRNGIKMSGVLRLPEVLCVHLKRFRHELMFSSKVAARVSFPLHDLNMAPYAHKDCTSKISRYELCAVICHAGTAGGGHYTCLARNARRWYEFDDQCVAQVSQAAVAAAEAYVLFYRKVNPQMAILRQKAAEILESASSEPNDMKFYISKQWINKFNTWAEPGPIDNSDFVCVHGGIRPDRGAHLADLAVQLPQPLWEFLHDKFGGGLACSHVHECGVCARQARRLQARTAHELATFYQLHTAFQEQEHPPSIYAISMQWFRQWQGFVRGNTSRPPPPVDNTAIVTKQETETGPAYVLKPGSDHAQLSEELWRFFTGIYGGGPEVRLKSPPQPPPDPKPEYYKYKRQSESDREDYCSKATSETNIRRLKDDSVLPKNAQSLQNIDRKYRHSHRASTDSDDDSGFQPRTKYEGNGNYDSDHDVDMNSVVNGFNTDANDNPISVNDNPLTVNDNPITGANENPIPRANDGDLLNMDSVYLKNMRKKHYRQFKRRTVK